MVFATCLPVYALPAPLEGGAAVLGLPTTHFLHDSVKDPVLNCYWKQVPVYWLL